MTAENDDLVSRLREALRALQLHVAYEATPVDRGGAKGPRGRAWAAFVEARDTALAKASATTPQPYLSEEPVYAWAVTSRAGAHIGLWTDEHTARAAAAQYQGSAVKKLYEHPQPSLPEGHVAVPVEPTHRHKKRGTEYVLLGIGKMQAEGWREAPPTGLSIAYGRPVDMREVAIYRSVDDGSLWVRPREEFEDGRFEPLDGGDYLEGDFS